MTESPTPSKFTKWKRPLIGGGLSAGIVVILQFFGLPGLFGPLVIIHASILGGYYLNYVGDYGLIISILLWFLIGYIIANFFRKTIGPIIAWLLIYIFFAIAGIIVFGISDVSDPRPVAILNLGVLLIVFVTSFLIRKRIMAKRG